MDRSADMSSLLDPPRTWTVIDLQTIVDAENWRRFEIVDGALVVSPSADSRHEIIAAAVLVALAPHVPAGLALAGPVGIDLRPSYRIPDVLVIPASRLDDSTALLRPEEVVLVVEVVSASSETTDRVTKPRQYAAAGIRAFWRIETRPAVTLTAYSLEPGAEAYTELGTWGPGERVDVDVPFPLTFEIDDLTP